MLETSRGISRFVILFDKVVIKFPSWKHGVKYFVMGMYGNLQEYEFYNIEHHPHLGKVYQCGPFGLWLVMKRYHNKVDRLLTSEEVDNIFNMFTWPHEVDNNGHNIYIENDKFILIDFGNSSLFYINNNLKWD